MRAAATSSSEIVLLQLEVCLGMVTDGAFLRGALGLDDRAAVAALPLVLADADPHFAGFNVLDELAVALLDGALPISSSRARRRKRGSPGCVRDPRASSRVETGVSGTS